LRRAIRRFGANQAVVAIVLVAGDAVAGLAAFFFDQVAARARKKLSDLGFGDASLLTITLTLIVPTRADTRINLVGALLCVILELLVKFRHTKNSPCRKPPHQANASRNLTSLS